VRPVRKKEPCALCIVMQPLVASPFLRFKMSFASPRSAVSVDSRICFP
jgi:hypothetical protein